MIEFRSTRSFRASSFPAAWDTVEAVLSSKGGTKTEGGGSCSRPEPYQEIVDSLRAGATLERCDPIP